MNIITVVSINFDVFNAKSNSNCDKQNVKPVPVHARCQQPTKANSCKVHGHPRNNYRCLSNDNHNSGKAFISDSFDAHLPQSLQVIIITLIHPHLKTLHNEVTLNHSFLSASMVGNSRSSIKVSSTNHRTDYLKALYRIYLVLEMRKLGLLMDSFLPLRVRVTFHQLLVLPYRMFCMCLKYLTIYISLVRQLETCIIKPYSCLMLFSFRT